MHTINSKWGINPPDRFAEDVLVEGTCEVAFKKAVVIYSFCHNAPHKLEVAQMV